LERLTLPTTNTACAPSPTKANTSAHSVRHSCAHHTHTHTHTHTHRARVAHCAFVVFPAPCESAGGWRRLGWRGRAPWGTRRCGRAPPSATRKGTCSGYRLASSGTPYLAPPPPCARILTLLDASPVTPLKNSPINLTIAPPQRCHCDSGGAHEAAAAGERRDEPHAEPEPELSRPHCTVTPPGRTCTDP
jgi:hypothetical protein